jgi:hypothetical protein
LVILIRLGTDLPPVLAYEPVWHDEYFAINGTTTWFERKLDFFEHFKRPKSFILGKTAYTLPGARAPALI